MLIQELKDRRASMRGDATKVVEYNILALVIGELETATLGKEHKVEITEEKVFAVIRKLIKSNNETLKIVANEKLVKENAYLETYLPSLMSEDQIREVIKFHHETIPFAGMGEIMKLLNSTNPGQFDKGVASKIAKEFL